MSLIRLTLLLTTIALGVSASHATDLLGAKQVLGRIEQGERPSKGQSADQQLLQKIRDYRKASSSIAPEESARAWFSLYDEIGLIDKPAARNDLSAVDVDTMQPVGVASIIAALPPPQAWPALRRMATERAQARPGDIHALAVRLMTEVLTRDRDAATRTLAALDVAAANLDVAERKRLINQVASERAWLVSLYGSPEDVAQSFLARARQASDSDPRSLYAGVPVPDLVGLVGDNRAGEVLRTALQQPVLFRSDDGDATRAMVRRLAREQVQTLGRAQWGLVDTPDQLPLYEALEKRFGNSTSDLTGADRSERQRADLVYLIALITAGRQEDAERQLKVVTRTSPLDLPKPVTVELQRAHQNEALFRFLHGLLPRQPELNVWDTYIQQAAYVGRSADALAVIDQLIARPGLPDYLVRSLRVRRISALLASDQVEPAMIQLRTVLAVEPSDSDVAAYEMSQMAIQASGLGRVLDRPEISRLGLSYLAKMLGSEGARVDRTEIVGAMYSELRKQGRADEAESLAIRELVRVRSKASGFEALAGEQSGAERTALVELVGIYDAAKRPTDVLALLDGATGWSAADLVEIVEVKDSLGVPVGLAAARALQARGDAAKAQEILRILLDRMPGYDPAYALFVDVASVSAIADLDRRYARDRFQERPLIWKAIALSSTGRASEAEAAVRAAIAIDPSDGDEGVNDRMRAYDVLAALLEAKGDTETAKTYRRAVEAIRLSEQGDELYKLGLYRRAIARYDAGLLRFSDAYCIQSRLAVQMSKLGLNSEALAHYRRAYELMPDSFGRVESHCFGCESVFQEPDAQGVADQVFTDLVLKTPSKPQAHYMLGYLRQEQRRYPEALRSFRNAVRLDAEYLNAWRHLQELAAHTYIEPAERDVAVLKLIELDPEQRHVSYPLNQMTNLGALWDTLQKTPPPSVPAPMYPLDRSARAMTTVLEGLPEAAREQMIQYRTLTQTIANGRSKAVTARQAIARHELIVNVASMLGAQTRGAYDFAD